MQALKTLILSIALSLFFVTIFGQKKTLLIENICKEFKAINNDASLLKKVLKADEFLKEARDCGGELTGFYKAGQLKKAVSWIGLSYGNRILEFYFVNNKLIFVYEEFNSFVYDNKKEKLRLDTTEKSFEGRYYFSENRLIDYKTSGHNRFEENTIDRQKTLLAEAEENKKALSQKK